MSVTAPEVIINDLVIKQVAAMAATGANMLQIADKLGISRYQVKKIMYSDLFKATVKEIGDDSVNQAKQIIRTGVRDLAVEVSRVLKEELGDNSLEAVKITLKVIGFDQQEPVKGDTNIQVVLPGGEKQTIEVESKVVDEQNND